MLIVVALACPGAAQDVHPYHPVPSIPDALLARPIALRAGIGAAHDAASTASEEAQAFYDQGLAYLHSFGWINAARSFNQALRLDPALAMAHVGLSVAYVEVNKPAPARASLERARALAARVSEHERRHIRIRALQLAAEEAPRDASRLAAYRAALADAVAAFPSDVELWLQRGVVESPDPADRGQGSTATSARFYEHVLADHPDHFAAHHYLTHARENAGRIEDALRHAEAYVRLAPGVPHAHHMHGHNLRRVGRIDEAIAEFRQAYELETGPSRAEEVPPEYDWHHQHNLDLLATSYQYVGQMKAAELFMRRSFQIASPLTLQEFGKHEWPAFLLARGRPDEARAAATVLTRSPAPLVRGIGHVMAGRALVALGRFAEAAGAANDALRELGRAGDEASLAAPYLKGLQAEFFLRTGDRQKGRAMFEEVARTLGALPGPDGWSQALFRLEAMARTAFDVEDWELAERVAMTMKDHDAAYAGTHQALALVAERKGDRATAIRELETAERAWSRADPDLPELVRIRATLAALDRAGPQEAPAAAGFHHVHLNSVDPAAAIAFYTRTFDVTKRTTVAGFEGLQSENIFLLFTKVPARPATDRDTAVWHFGWGSPDVEADYAKHAATGVSYATPLTRLGSGVQFAYMRGPDGALVEINTSQTRAFLHVHLYSEKPLCTAEWYETHLGAARRGGGARTGPCDVPFAAPSEPLGVIRSPAATVRLEDINLIIYPRQRPGPLASTRGRVVDHIAVSYPDVPAALDRLRRVGVTVLEDVRAFGKSGARSAMIEGPDSIAIELVERR